MARFCTVHAIGRPPSKRALKMRVATAPMPENVMWWIEIEKPNGAKEIGSAKPLRVSESPHEFRAGVRQNTGGLNIFVRARLRKHYEGLPKRMGKEHLAPRIGRRYGCKPDFRFR